MTVKRLIGSAPEQVSRNKDLGSLAFQNKEAPRFDSLTIDNSVGVGTLLPTARLDVGGGSFTAALEYTYQNDYNVNPSTNVTINVRDGASNLVNGYVYRVRLNTPGTGANTGAVYTVYQTAVDTWTAKLISSAEAFGAATSNNPRLIVSGTTLQIYHTHPSMYTIHTLVQTMYTGNVTRIYPTVFGLENGAISVVGTNVGMGTNDPQTNLHVYSSTQAVTKIGAPGNSIDIIANYDAGTSNSTLRIAGNGGNRGNIQIAETNSVLTNSVRSVTYGNNLYLNGVTDAWVQPALTIGGAAIRMTGPNGSAGEIIFMSAQDPDVATSIYETARIDANGWFGLGTNGPASAPLHVRTSQPASIVTAGILSASGNGNPGRGVALSFQPGGSGNSVEVAKICGLQEVNATTATAAALTFQVANASGVLTESMRISNLGNVGISTTPKAWSTSFPALQIDEAGFWGVTGAQSYAGMSANMYISGSSLSTTSKYINSSMQATAYVQALGAHYFYSAPTGTADALVSLTRTLYLAKDETLALQGATATTGCGIAFPATDVASANANTLDDYEEGTFVPVAIGTTTTGVGTYGAQQGRYTKIGNRVIFSLYLTWSAHTGTGNLRISSLPFTSAGSIYNAMSIWASGLTLTASNEVSAYQEAGSNYIIMQQSPIGGGSATNVAMDTAVGGLMLSGSYNVA